MYGGNHVLFIYENKIPDKIISTFTYNAYYDVHVYIRAYRALADNTATYIRISSVHPFSCEFYAVAAIVASHPSSAGRLISRP